MRYSDQNLVTLIEQFEKCITDLNNAQLRCILECSNTKSPDAIEHLTQGAGRRISILRHSLSNIFNLLPPDNEEPVESNSLNDAQVNLHAFFINLVGLFDNFAWAFAHHHNLASLLSKQHSISLFNPKFQESIPTKLSSYLTSNDIANWHNDYLKNYRDALAHRIPLYIPPSNIPIEDKSEYERLEKLYSELIYLNKFEEADAVRMQQRRYEKSCFSFIHSFKEGACIVGPVYVHPQLLSDTQTALSIANIFLDEWQNHS